MSLDTSARPIELEANQFRSGPGLAPDMTATLAPGRADAAPRKEVEPVRPGERFFAIDALRGFAVLCIFATNIVGLGWSWTAYYDPYWGGGFDGMDRVVWYFTHTLFEAKGMTLFCMLFGAGLVLMDERASARGTSIRAIYYRRNLWLLMIGLVHSYLIWDGDVLVFYALAGLLLYSFRGLHPGTLIALGLSLLLITVPLALGYVAGIDYMKSVTARVDAQIAAGEKPSEIEKRVHAVWTGSLRDILTHSPDSRAREWDLEQKVYRGDYLGIVEYKLSTLPMTQVYTIVAGDGLFVASRMLLGMAFMKLGVFSALWSRRFYAWMCALGYGIGLPLSIFDATELVSHRFAYDYYIHGGALYNVFGSLIVAMGHVGLVMLLAQTGSLSWLTNRLAAVGRMALTHYLGDSIFGTTLFYGYGFGLFAQINRTGLAAIMVVVWVFQLLMSPVWFRYFRYGPTEWIWRSLTYWRLQPMRQKAKAAQAIAT